MIGRKKEKMEKVIEFNVDREDLKKYIEECLTEENIDYEIKMEDRWIEKYEQASKYYKVYCLYVNNSNLEKVEKIVKDFQNATIVTDDVEEFRNIEEEDDDNRFKIFTKKNFLKYYYGAIIIIGILIIIGIKFIDYINN